MNQKMLEAKSKAMFAILMSELSELRLYKKLNEVDKKVQLKRINELLRS